jgi:hypothetical protein
MESTISKSLLKIHRVVDYEANIEINSRDYSDYIVEIEKKLNIFKSVHLSLFDSNNSVYVINVKNFINFIVQNYLKQISLIRGFY